MSETIHVNMPHCRISYSASQFFLSGLFTISVKSLNKGVIWRVKKRIKRVRMVRKLIRKPHEVLSGFVYGC